MKFERSFYTAPKSPPWDHFLGNRFADLLPYESWDNATRLFWNRGSVGFVLKGHPLVGANLEDQDRIADFLKEEAHLPEGSSLQVLLWASPMIGNLLSYWKQYRQKSPFDLLAQKRIEHFQTYVLGENQVEGQVLRDFRVYISYSLPVSSLTSVQEGHVLETRRSLTEALRSVGLFITFMTGEELVQEMSDLLHPDASVFPEPFTFSFEESLRRQMVRSDRRRIVTDRGVLHESPSGPWVWRGFIPRKWPHVWALGHMERFLGDLLGSPSNLPTPFWVHYGICIAHHQGREKALNTTRRESLESSLKSRLSKWIPDLEEEYQEAREVVEELQRGERVVLSQLCVGILARASESVRVEQTYRSLWTKLGFEFRETTFDHLPMLLSCCPMSWSWKERKRTSFKRPLHNSLKI